MTWRFQYQTLVEPLVTTAAPETVTLDKWFQELSDPGRRRRSVEGAVVAPLEPTLFTAPPALSWAPAVSQPVIPKRRLAREGFFAAPLEPSLTVAPPALSWAPSVSETRPKRRLAPLGLFAQPDFSTVQPDETITVDKWAQPVQQPVIPRRKAPREGLFAEPIEPSLFAAPPALSWLPAAADVRRKAPRRPEAGSVAPDPAALAAAPESVTLDKWQAEAKQPAARKRRSVGGDGAVLVEFTPDGWLALDVRPAARPRRRQEAGSTGPTEPSLFDVPDLSDWYQAACEPVRQPPRLANEGGLFGSFDTSAGGVTPPVAHVTVTGRGRVQRTATGRGARIARTVHKEGG